jgi:UDP-glucose 4-epimerase
VAIARVFSAYGEGLRRQLLWDVCRRVGDGPLRLSGTGDETRDFLHVDDVGRAMATIVARGAFGGTIYNVGSGAATTVATVAATLVQSLGGDPDDVTFDGAVRAGDPRAWQADVGRLTALGFAPTVEIDAGLRRYAAWASAELRVAR